MAALTGTLVVGGDGSGDIFTVDLAKTRSCVHIFGHDTAEIRPLAKSFTAFAALNDLEERWDAFCDTQGVDGDDLLEGDVDRSSAEFRRLERDARALEVNLAPFAQTCLRRAPRAIRGATQ
jgi:hypothetical protein